MKKIRKRILRYVSLTVLCLGATLSMQAQFLDYGTDPAHFRWRIARLPHYNLIYPVGTDSMACRYATYLENVYPHMQKTMGTGMQTRFPVVLHPANMQSNGLVSWAPRRMELITTPSFDQDGVSWDRHLVLHESRHTVQTSKVMRGWTKALYYVIGEQAQGIASLFLPRWFLEGDAVGTETAMSGGGRGRLPEFGMTYRAQLLEGGKNYSLDKWYMGSYRDYTGNYYALGYYLTSFARHRYGADIWDKTTTRYVRRFWAIPMFGNALKHYAGVGVDGLYKETFRFLHGEWAARDTAAVAAPAYLSPASKRYVSYRYPQAVDDTTVVAVRQSLGDITSLVALSSDGKERRLCYMGSLSSRPTYAEGRIYWTEIIPGLRYTHDNHSVVKQYDMATHRLTTLTPRRRYISLAAGSRDGRAAASVFTTRGESRLVLLDLATGEEKGSFASPRNAFLKEPAYGDNGRVTVVAVPEEGGTSLLQLDTQTGEWTTLLPPIPANITAPYMAGDTLYFECGIGGTNNIYALHLSDTTVSRLTSARFGAFDPTLSPRMDRLLYADYHATGYRIASLPTDSLRAEHTDLYAPYCPTLAGTLAGQEAFNLDTAALSPVTFAPRPYRKGLHLLKLHSWAPFYYDVTQAMQSGTDDLSTIVKPGAMLLSQNTLNTAVMQAGWYYSHGEHHGRLSFSYTGLFPVFDLTADYGGKAFGVEWVTDDEGHVSARMFTSRRTLFEAEARVYLPLNLTRSHRIRGIQPAVTYHFTNDRYRLFASGADRNFQYILPEVLIYDYRKKATSDILPRWGYRLRLGALLPVAAGDNFGSTYAARLTTYFPGILRGHGLMLRANYQYQALDGKRLYLPKRLIDPPRGYSFAYLTHRQVALKADYAFPLCTPDISLGSIAYIRRLRANIFYDHSRNRPSPHSGWTTQSSYGMDLFCDWNALRLSFPLTAGIRLAKPIDNGSLQTEALFSVTF